MNKVIKLSLCLLFLATFNFACGGVEEPPLIPEPEKEYVVTLGQTDLSLKEGSRQQIIAQFNEDAAGLSYRWISSDPAIIELEDKKTNSATIYAVSPGTATVTLESTDKVVSVQCKVTVIDGTVRLLAIGNSFSEDAVEQYLYNLAQAEGIKLVIGNMVIGGCSIDRHWENICNNKADYSYRKIVDGKKTTMPDKALSDVIKEEEWDYISIQQVSGNSGILSTYVKLTDIMAYLRENATKADVKFILHQTWAYAQNSTHGDFPRYGSDQLRMYNAIIETTKAVAERENIDIITPSGTAIQNGRTSFIGDNFTRDGYHLDVSHGRYTAACAWFEKLFGMDVRNNTYAPAGLSVNRANAARAAAHFAVQNPYEITDLVDFKDTPGIKELTKPVYIDFGQADRVSSSPWNNITSTSTGSSIELKDEDGTELGIELVVKERFGGINSSGPTVVQVPGFNLPETATCDSFFGNMTEFSGQTSPEGKIEIKGLNPSKKYDFLFFGSRTATDNRETKYTVTGTNEVTVCLNTSSNTTTAVCANGIKPRSDRTVSISVTAGQNNNNSNGFYYINAMKLSPSE